MDMFNPIELNVLLLLLSGLFQYFSKLSGFVIARGLWCTAQRDSQGAGVISFSVGVQTLKPIKTLEIQDKQICRFPFSWCSWYIFLNATNILNSKSNQIIYLHQKENCRSWRLGTFFFLLDFATGDILNEIPFHLVKKHKELKQMLATRMLGCDLFKNLQWIRRGLGFLERQPSTYFGSDWNTANKRNSIGDGDDVDD